MNGAELTRRFTVDPVSDDPIIAQHNEIVRQVAVNHDDVAEMAEWVFTQSIERPDPGVQVELDGMWEEIVRLRDGQDHMIADYLAPTTARLIDESRPQAWG